MPDFGQYYTGLVFLDHETESLAKEEFNKCAIACGLEVNLIYLFFCGYYNFYNFDDVVCVWF